MPDFKAAVVTVSDACSRGEREDLSGPAVAEILSAHNFQVIGSVVIPDEREQIRETLVELCAVADLIVTTGGTGIAARDVTPEATREVCERFIEGIPEKMRLEGAKHTKFAPLSRGVCGIRGTSIVLNLPGSPAGATESLLSVVDLLTHALNLLRGDTAHPPDWHSKANNP